jgi:hypothetical protein
MAYAFLKALGVDGEIGTFTVELKNGKMKTSKGHRVISSGPAYQIESSRYPFCPCEPSGKAAPAFPVCDTDDATKDSSIRSAISLIPFNQDLNRLMLIAKGGKSASYKVTWGDNSKTFSSDELARGINLMDAFPQTPFGEAFAKVDAAVAAKQAYETKQIKQSFRSPEAKSDMESVAARTEKEREPLASAIKTAFAPVTHTLRIDPL